MITNSRSAPGPRTAAFGAPGGISLHRPPDTADYVFPGQSGFALAWPDLACGPGEPARVAAPVPRRAGRGVRGRGVHRVALRGGGTAAGRDHSAPGRARRDGRPAGPQAPRQDGPADARHLRDLLLDDRIPESWIPPAHVLEARALVRLYKDLLEERTSWQQRVHATLFHQGIPVVPKLGTADGQQRLDAAELSAAGRRAVQAGLRQIGRLTQEMASLRRELARLSSRQPGCRALRRAHYGIGGLLSVAVRAELGDCRRFSSSDDAVRHTGLDITIYDSDGKRARVTLPGKDPRYCCGRCMRQRCTHPARPRRTTPATAASGTGSTGSARCCRWPAGSPAAATKRCGTWARTPWRRPPDRHYR
jgi:Transposase IS116/IS110/IS902 family